MWGLILPSFQANFTAILSGQFHCHLSGQFQCHPFRPNSRHLSGQFNALFQANFMPSFRPISMLSFKPSHVPLGTQLSIQLKTQISEHQAHIRSGTKLTITIQIQFQSTELTFDWALSSQFQLSICLISKYDNGYTI